MRSEDIVQRELGLYSCRGCGCFITLHRSLMDEERGILENWWEISSDRCLGHPDAWCQHCWSDCFGQGVPPVPPPPSANVDLETLRRTLSTRPRPALGCPVCGRTDDTVHQEWDRWRVCDQHRTKWVIASRWHTPFQDVSEEESERRGERLKGYREVEPMSLSGSN